MLIPTVDQLLLNDIAQNLEKQQQQLEAELIEKHKPKLSSAQKIANGIKNLKPMYSRGDMEAGLRERFKARSANR